MQFCKITLLALLSLNRISNFISAGFASENGSTERRFDLDTAGRQDNRGLQEQDYYVITDRNNICLEPASVANARPMIRKPCNDGDSQKWKVTTDSTFGLIITPKASDIFMLATDPKGNIKIANAATIGKWKKPGRWFIDSIGNTIRQVTGGSLKGAIAQNGNRATHILSQTVATVYYLDLLTEAPTGAPTGMPTSACLDNDALIQAIEDNYDSNFADVSASWRTCEVTNMENLISSKAISDVVLEFGNWDTSRVTTMEGAFSNSPVVQAGLGDWDTSNVVNMNYMFFLAKSYDEDIAAWDVSSVRYFKATFAEAEVFNEDITTWNVDQAENMWSMFNHALVFNQPVKTMWDLTGKTTDLMFASSPLE